MDSPRIEHHKLHSVVTQRLQRIEGRGPLPLSRHFTITRVGADMRVGCWCGKARVLETQFPNRFARLLDDFLWTHDLCQAKEGV